MEASDTDLLAQGRAGNQNAFNELMRRHEDRVYAICYRVTGNRSDALDAVQDTFISVFRRASTFRGDSAFSTWIYRIAVNASRDLLRKKARTPIPQEEFPEPAPDRRPGVEDTVTMRTDLRAALDALPDEYREAVVLFDIAGVPYEEIARITDTAIGTVKSRISRGRRKLAAFLEQAEPPAASKEQI